MLFSDFVEKDEGDEQFLYELYAISVHSGGMGGGHYIAYAKHRIGVEEKWFYYSDSHYQEVSEQQVLSAQAYVLFYRRR